MEENDDAERGHGGVRLSPMYRVGPVMGGRSRGCNIQDLDLVPTLFLSTCIILGFFLSGVFVLFLKGYIDVIDTHARFPLTLLFFFFFFFLFSFPPCAP